MLGSGFTVQSLLGHLMGFVAFQTQVDVFDQLYWVFLVLGTLVGVVVIGYLCYNAYLYRTEATAPEGRYDVDEEELAETDDYEKVARPQLGEVPSKAGGSTGKKVFLSFAISAIIVLALVIFAYWNLLYVEDTEPDMEVTVVADQFSFTYEYPSGETDGDLVVPEGRVIGLNVTSCHPGNCEGDVMHNWGSPELRAKTDAIPGEYTSTWFQTDEVGEYSAICYELCGAGHTSMRNDDEIRVVSEEEFIDWCDDNDCMDGDRDDIANWLEETGGDD